MRTVVVIQYGNFTEHMVGVLSVPDGLDLDQEQEKWRQTHPETRIQSHWEYPNDYLEFLLKVPGITRVEVEIHRL